MCVSQMSKKKNILTLKNASHKHEIYVSLSGGHPCFSSIFQIRDLKDWPRIESFFSTNDDMVTVQTLITP